MPMPSAGAAQRDRTRLTYSDYLLLPDDGKRYEVIDGVLFMTPAPVPRHQKVSRKLQYLLMEALEKTGKGEVYDAPIDVLLDDENIVQPDLLFIRSDRLKIIGEKHIQSAPDIVIEILSESSRRRDVLTKASLYARFGVPHYWVVDPEVDRIEFYRLEGTIYRLDRTATSPEVVTLPEIEGIRIPLGEIFS